MIKKETKKEKELTNKWYYWIEEQEKAEKRLELCKEKANKIMSQMTKRTKGKI